MFSHVFSKIGYNISLPIFPSHKNRWHSSHGEVNTLFPLFYFALVLTAEVILWLLKLCHKRSCVLHLALWGHLLLQHNSCEEAQAIWPHEGHMKKSQPPPTLQSHEWVLMKVDPPAPIKLILSRTKKSYRFMSKINGGGCFKSLSFRVVWREGTIHLSNEVQWNPSPLTPDWIPLHSVTASRSSLPHAFLTPLLPWECLLPTAVLLLLDGFTQLPCGLWSSPRCPSWLWYLSPLKPWRTLFLPLICITTIKIQHISLLARPSTDCSEEGLWCYFSCDLVTLHLAAKLIAHSLSSSNSLYTPSGQTASYIFVQCFYPPCKTQGLA